MIPKDNPQPLFQLENLKQEYDGKNILNIKKLSIHRQEILAIVGPNGAGKSTLLRILDFLETPNHGKLYFEGQLINEPPSTTTRRKVSMMFQNPQLLNASVKSNIEYGLKIRGQSKNDKLVNKTLKQVGLNGLAHNNATSISGGELQRVALARTLILASKVLLLDEPTSNLDPYNTGLIESLIIEHHKLHQSTIILVTHNLHQARRLSKRCALLLDGELIEIAPTEDFFDRPNDIRVSEFVHGKMIY